MLWGWLWWRRGSEERGFPGVLWWGQQHDLVIFWGFSFYMIQIGFWKRRTIIMLFSCCWMFQLLEGYYNNFLGNDCTKLLGWFASLFSLSNTFTCGWMFVSKLPLTCSRDSLALSISLSQKRQTSYCNKILMSLMLQYISIVTLLISLISLSLSHILTKKDSYPHKKGNF